MAAALLIGGLACTAALPAFAQAKPIVPRTAPLVVTGAGLGAARCPSTAEVDGSRLVTLARESQSDRRFPWGSMTPFFYLTVAATPAVVLCDPARVATGRPLGPIGGSTTATLSADLATGGTRAIGAPPEAVSDSALHVGDRVTLPAAGPGAVLDVFVRTPGGARLVRVGPLGPRGATAASVGGTKAVPELIVERTEGEPTRHAVPTRRVTTPAVRARVKGRDLVLAGSAWPSSVATLVSGEAITAERVVTGGGRFALAPMRLARKTETVQLLITDYPRRTSVTVRCAVRWDAQRRRHRAPRCRLHASATRAVVPASRHHHTKVAPAQASAAANAAARLRARAAPLPTTPAAVTEVAATALTGVPELANDLDGNGLPELYIDTFDEKARDRLYFPRKGEPTVRVSLRRDAELFEDLFFAPAPWTPDLDGDGRGEVLAGSGVLVTDAFAKGLPSTLDLRRLRPTSARDLDLGIASDGLLSSLATVTEPLGSVSDVTGDGRREPVLGTTGISAIFSSEAIAYNRRSRLALTTPLAWPDDTTLDDVYEAPELSQAAFGTDPVRQAKADAGALVRAGRLITLMPTDPVAKRHTARTFVVRSTDASGNVIELATVAATAAPRLVDHDPASGDSLIVLYAPGACEKERECSDRVVRVGAGGQVRAEFTLRRDRIFEVTFAPDGPDSDDAVDIAAWFGGGTMWTRGRAPSWLKGRDGTISIFPSTLTGTVDPLGQPVLASAGGAPLRSVHRIESVALDDGARWLGLLTGNPKKPSTYRYVLVQPTR